MTCGRWQNGIAFIHGINMYGSNRVTKAEMLGTCKQIEGDSIRILGLVKSDNVIFEKRGMHYATVGGILERVLSKSLNRPIHVTTRGFKTLRKCVGWEEFSK